MATGFLFGAGDEARTRYLDLGKVALYQMSYARRTGLIIPYDSAFVNPIFYFFSRKVVGVTMICYKEKKRIANRKDL